MKMLSSSNYEKAVHALHQVARPLEKALYAYHFDNGSIENVLAELAKFQNSDGGFGHGLEADIRLPDSSVIATTVAFQKLGEIAASTDLPIVQKGCAYLVNTYRADDVNWPIIPKKIDDAPHAPWWTPGGGLEKSLSNPRAEIAGILNTYPEHFPDEMREQVTHSVVDQLLNSGDEMEMHDLLCNIRFWEASGLPEETERVMLDKLNKLVSTTVARDPAAWREYGLPPLGVISEPDSPFAEDYREEIPLNLDFIIDSQDADGLWKPSWSWGVVGDPAWAQAAKEWTGVITLDNLRKLQAFGRINFTPDSSP